MLHPIFYTAAGIHALHVIAGAIIMMFVAADAKKNLELVGAPAYTEGDQKFARELQEFLALEPPGLSTRVAPLDDEPEPVRGGSTDVAEVSWITKMSRLPPDSVWVPPMARDVSNCPTIATSSSHDTSHGAPVG